MKIISYASLGLVLAALAGCQQQEPADPDQIPNEGETGQLRLFLNSTDDPEDLDSRVEEVWVRIDSVQVRHEDRGWIELSEQRQDIDLMGDDVRGGQALLGEAEVWVGAYDRITVGVEDAWVVVNGQEQDLQFQGDIDPLDPMWVGMSIDESFFVDEGQQTTVRITWNLADNLQERNDGWSLRGDTIVEVEIGDEGMGGGGDGGAGGGAGGGGDDGGAGGGNDGGAGGGGNDGGGGGNQM